MRKEEKDIKNDMRVKVTTPESIVLDGSVIIICGNNNP